MPPRNQITEEQWSVLDDVLSAQSNHWVRGYAGSGKSVIMMQALSEVLIKNPGASACVVTFTHALKAMLKSGRRDNVADVPVFTPWEFKREGGAYDYVFVDEVQDLKPDIIEMIKSRCSLMVVAGDEEQSIYKGVRPEDIEALISPKIHKLNWVFRLTEKLRKVVGSILPNSQILTASNMRVQADVKVALAKADSEEDEFDWVWREAQMFSRTGEPAAILLPGHPAVQEFISRACRASGVAVPDFPRPYINGYRKYDYSHANKLMAENGLILRYLGNDYGDFEEADRSRIIYVMTYHSAKGLDFECVFLPGLSQHLEIWSDDDDMERRLFFVAASRSRRHLFMSYTGEQPHRFVRAMPQELLDQLQAKAVEEQSSDNAFDDVY